MADGNFFVDRVHPHSPGTFPFALGLRSSPLCLMKLPAAFSAFSVVATLSLTLALTTDAPAASALPKSSVVYNAGDPATATKLTDAQLETLLGPVALYPDALIALILPASASSSDIVLAARYLAANQDPQQLDAQAWDESVRSLARYPDVIKWLDENLAWTQQLGTAFLAQPAEVMQAVQRLRARARAAGTLIDTPQQKVITEGEVILIEPASPTVIYVPRYDPEVVYVSRPYGWTQPSLFFGLGFGVGSWLSYDCDWRTRTIVVGDWRRRPQTVWVRPAFPHRPPAPGVTVVVGRPWQPPAHRHPRSTVIVNDPRRPVVIVNPRPYYEHPRRPGSDDPRRPESGPRSRSETRPTTTTVIVNAPPTLSPPPVVMPPAHTIGGPPPGERRRERPTTNLDNPTANPERPRPDVPRGPRGGSSNPDAPREPRPTPNPDRPRSETPRESRPESNRRDSGGNERTSRPSAPAPDRSMPDRRSPERVAPPAPPPRPVVERPPDSRVDEHAR